MSNYKVHTEDYRGYHIEILPDNDGLDSPRDWDNLGVMACWHRRGNYGNVQPKENPLEHIHNLVSKYWRMIENDDAFLEWSKVQAETDDYDDVDTYIEEMDAKTLYSYFNRFYVSIPIYAYEHGGITIRSGSFGDPFDSGQLGFIYVEKSKALKEWSLTEWTAEFEQKIISILDSEIKVYDDYLTGNVYGYCIYKQDDELEDDDSSTCEYEDTGEVLESCWGFFPVHDRGPDYGYCLQEAKDWVDWQVKQDLAEAWERSINSEMGE